ncbi:MAG: alpha/beta fold hydrolase [Syntrophorhabdales bacterium]
MSTYVLIHGAWHGAWCWAKVTPLFTKQGHKVVAFDLPGHGRDKTPLADVSLQAYVDRVCEILDAQPEPVILVGHSMGGMVITQAAEYRPEKIRKLVYVSAFLPRDGESVIALSEANAESLLGANMIVSDDRRSMTLRNEGIKEALYGDCSDEDVARAKSLLVPQAAAPFMAPVKTTEGRFGTVRRVYISCLRDKAVTPACQEKMYNALPCEKVIFMDTSHSPFFSAPEELAGHLATL